MYTVTCSLPDLCDAGDWQDTEPTPVDAVEAFIHALTLGEGTSYVYTVQEDGGERRTFRVDMASGPSVELLPSRDTED